MLQKYCKTSIVHAKFFIHCKQCAMGVIIYYVTIVCTQMICASLLQNMLQYVTYVCRFSANTHSSGCIMKMKNTWMCSLYNIAIDIFFADLTQFHRNQWNITLTSHNPRTGLPKCRDTLISMQTSSMVICKVLLFIHIQCKMHR